MKFDDEWDQLKQSGHYGSFSFNGTAADWRSTVSAHFKASKLQRPCYGVYVVRQKSTNQVIYVGKAGTMQQGGTYKKQDLQERLVNRENGQARQVVFGQRVVDHGELLIEYVVLKSKSLISGYIEARLLQAYFDDNQKLPIDNASL